jgi:hypothetical protein
MSGCFGDSPEDRHFERQLNEYLDREDEETCRKRAAKKLEAEEDRAADRYEERYSQGY